MTWRALPLLLVLATPLQAVELTLPAGLSLTSQDIEVADSVRLPEGPWVAGQTPTQAEGAITRRVYARSGSALTTLQIIGPVRDGLAEQGFREIYACADRACGGFDFRFQLDLIAAPDMFVDLGDYRYALYRDDDATDGAPRDVALVASRSGSTAFLHVTLVSDAPLETVQETVDVASVETIVPVPSGPLIDRLLAGGHVTLDDLVFDTGSATLSDGNSASLTTLAEWLIDTPGARVALVGHTDAVGSLDGNVRLSQRRASSVVDRLVAAGVPTAQLQALGAGYMAPRGSNLSEDGRALNRRVEAVLLSLE